MALRSTLKISLLAGAFFAVAVPGPVSAASALSEAFAARIRPDIDVLDRSSRLALETSKAASIRSFAHREAIEQTIAANSLVAWTQANTLDGAEVALQTRLPGTAPVSADAAVSGEEVLSGRSVAIDRPLTVTRAPRTAAEAPDEGAVERLATLKGAEFDAAYRSIQRETLTQLADLYTDFIQNGDDPALRALATRELPKINRRLTELRRS